MSTTLLTVALIGIGGLVRATESGLGCPDWPKCRGGWIPPADPSAIIEYSHRLVAAIVGTLVLILAIVAWTKFRSLSSVVWPSVLALIAVIVQGGVGRVVVERELPSTLVAFHFGISLTLLALLTITTVNAYRPRGGRFGPLAAAGLWTAISVAALVMLGALVSEQGAALVFPDWPLMDGALLPSFGESAHLTHFLHRAGALLAGLVVFAALIRVRKSAVRPVVNLAKATAGLWLVQVALGASNVLTGSAPWTVVAHVLLGAAAWTSAVAFVAAGYRFDSADTSEPVARGRVAQVVSAYFMLTKPRIIELLLITTVPAMILASGGFGDLGLMAAVLLGGSLTAGSANAINCFFDRDIDSRMDRTKQRPLPQGSVEPGRALVFGLVLGFAGFVLLWVAANPLAAAIAGGAILFYVFVYTIWLKRSTPANIVIGGAAGAAPALVGWAAVTGRVELPALLLFGIVFYWTPPHFWALALRYEGDYAAAGVPMLPGVKGADATFRKMLTYAVALTALSLLLVPAGLLSPVYLVVALGLGGAFVAQIAKTARKPGPVTEMALFRFSTLYLTVLFAAVAVEPFIPIGNVASLNAPVTIVAGAVFLFAQAFIWVDPRGWVRVAHSA